MQKKTAAAIALGARAGIGVGAAAVSCGASKAMTDLAMDRKIPGYSRFFNVSGKKKSDGGFSAARKKAMEALEALPRQDVTIRSADGLTLKGHLLTCKYPRRLIIAFHGWRSSWSRDFGLVAPFWLENHCNVLLVEQRAHGDSQGDYLGFGLGAASLVDNVRFQNGRDLITYLENPQDCREEEQVLTEQEQMEETMFLGLRLIRGISYEQFEKQYGRSLPEVYGPVITQNIADGLLREYTEESGERFLALTEKGLDVSNYVMAQFLF